VLSWPRQKADRYIASCYRNAAKRFSLQSCAVEYLMLTEPLEPIR